MRKSLFVLILPLVIVGCVGNVHDEYTPTVYVNYFVNNNGDTLSVNYNDKLDLSQLDTMNIGDTISTVVIFDAVGNNLTCASVEWDHSSADVWTTYTADVAALFLSQTDSLNFKFYLPTGYRYLRLPMYYVPTQAGTPTITFHVESDSKFSPTDISLLMPAK